MTHYVSQIRRYDNVNNFNTEHNETAYKYLINIFFDRINKRDTF